MRSLDRQLQLLRRARQQEMPRLRRRLAQRHRGDLDGFAGDGRALVGHARGIAEHHDDARKGHVEFFGDDLAERGADAGAEIDMAVEGGDRAVGGDLDEGFETAFARRSRANDGQRSRGMHRASGGHQSRASATWPAARIAARMISICAPQRHRL